MQQTVTTWIRSSKCKYITVFTSCVCVAVKDSNSPNLGNVDEAFDHDFVKAPDTLDIAAHLPEHPIEFGDVPSEKKDKKKDKKKDQKKDKKKAATTEAASTISPSTESASTDSASTDSASTDGALDLIQGSTESASTDDASTDDASTDSASTDDASTDSASTDSASATTTTKKDEKIKYGSSFLELLRQYW